MNESYKVKQSIYGESRIANFSKQSFTENHILQISQNRALKFLYMSNRIVSPLLELLHIRLFGLFLPQMNPLPILLAPGSLECCYKQNLTGSLIRMAIPA